MKVWRGDTHGHLRSSISKWLLEPVSQQQNHKIVTRAGPLRAFECLLGALGLLEMAARACPEPAERSTLLLEHAPEPQCCSKCSLVSARLGDELLSFVFVLGCPAPTSPRAILLALGVTNPPGFFSSPTPWPCNHTLVRSATSLVEQLISIKILVFLVFLCFFMAQCLSL